jgi:hypothetical protein
MGEPPAPSARPQLLFELVAGFAGSAFRHCCSSSGGGSANGELAPSAQQLLGDCGGVEVDALAGEGFALEEEEGGAATLEALAGRRETGKAPRVVW